LDPADESTLAETRGNDPNGFAEFLSAGVSAYNQRYNE